MKIELTALRSTVAKRGYTSVLNPSHCNLAIITPNGVTFYLPLSYEFATYWADEELVPECFR